MSDLKVVPFQKPSHHNLDNDQVIRLLKQALELSLIHISEPTRPY